MGNWVPKNVGYGSLVIIKCVIWKIGCKTLQDVGDEDSSVVRSV